MSGEETGTPKAAQPPIPRGRLDALYVCLLILTLSSGPYLWLARIAWMMLAVLFVMNFRYAVFSLFFFASFFQPAGFALDFVFTIKHLHIAILLIAFIELYRQNLGRSLQNGIRNAGVYIPVGLLILVGIFNYLRFENGLTALRIPFNVLLVLLMMIYFQGILITFSQLTRKPILRQGMVFFTLGVSYQVAAGFMNTLFGSEYLNEGIVHNNHLGFFCLLAVFYAIIMRAGAKERGPRTLSFIMLMIILSGLVASCSRTVWFSFIGSLLFFLCGMQRFALNGRQRNDFSLSRRALLLLLLVIVVLLCLFRADVWQRVSYIPQLIDPNYWAYTLNDRQNFGFLGIYRLRDIHRLAQIVPMHFWLGFGFMREVVDMHGLFFAILGSCGFLGLCLFVVFIVHIIQSLWNVMVRNPSSPETPLVLACASTLLAWGMVSFMESFFLQFAVWIQVALMTCLVTASPGGIEK